MKDAFEHNLKDSLENFEMPYNASAWTAMQSALNANVGAPSSSFEQQIKESVNGTEYPYNPAAWTALNEKLGAPKGKSFTKWYVAAGILVVATAAIWYVTSDDSVQKSKPSKDITTTEVNSEIAQQDKPSTDSKPSTSNVDQNAATTPSSTVTNTPANSVTQGNHQSNTPANGGHDATPNAGNNTNNANNGGTGGNDRNGTGPISVATVGTYILPERQWKYITSNIGTICQGATIQIENKNNFPLHVKYPNGLLWTGRENGNTSLNPSAAGTYIIGYQRDNQFIEKETFVVLEAPKAEFEFVDLSQKYLNGLPTVEVRTNVAAQSYDWQFDQVHAQGPSAAAHFFTRGAHTIALNVTDASGCKSTIEKTVNIDENYNLIAMKGFEPLDLDPRNNTFLPYALKERNVGFKMIILDPRDGHLIYETSDASQGWDGVDQSTGSMVKFQTAYIWKVTLNNPAPGEKSEYAGTIIPTQR